MNTFQEKIAIPRFGESVAPCFGYSATIAIFTCEDGQVLDQTDYTLQSQRALDRVRLLRDQGVDTLICGGLQDRVEDMIRAKGIKVVSWVKGDVADLLCAYFDGQLDSGSACRAVPPETPDQQQ